jgi:hypothetical protein
MYSKYLGSFISYGFGFTILTIVMFGALRYFQIPTGHLTDWIIGLATAWWLLMIVTVPWNVYFEAKGVAAESEQSGKIGIIVNTEDASYVTTVARRALMTAIVLHLLSAIALFSLSALAISPVGYIGSACALLLTALRPSVRAYEYLWQRLNDIKHRIHYPREDVLQLRQRVEMLETRTEVVEHELDASRPTSFAARQSAEILELSQSYRRIAQTQDSLQDENRREHIKLARDAEQSIAKISADTQFLDHVREIVRLIKSA